MQPVLPSIDPLVDLYNAISLAYAVPVGGENLQAYVGVPRLVLADGSECFDTFKEGALVHEAPAAGEVVWRGIFFYCESMHLNFGIDAINQIKIENPHLWDLAL